MCLAFSGQAKIADVAKSIRFVPRLFYLMVKLATGLTKAVYAYKAMVRFWKKEPLIAWGYNQGEGAV